MKGSGGWSVEKVANNKIEPPRSVRDAGLQADHPNEKELAARSTLQKRKDHHYKNEND